MIGEDTFYIQRFPRVVEVHGNVTAQYPLTLNNLIDKELEKSLSNMEGRLLSTKRVYNIKKLTPIYINQKIILQPLDNMQAWNLILVNICNIKKIEEYKMGTLITSINGDTLYSSVGIKRLLRYINNCKKVLAGQDDIERGYKKYGKKEY